VSTAHVALVTGAGGFAGIHLLNELARQTNWELVGLSRTGRPAHPSATMLSCDLQDADLVRRVIERWRPSVIMHLAAQTYVPKSFGSPSATLVNNLVSQVNLLESVRMIGLDSTILIVGSAEEYGRVQADELPLREDQPFRPTSPYGVSKVSQDVLGLQYHLSHAMRVVRVRPFNHTGPGQSDRFVMSNFARQVVEAELGRIEPVILTGDITVERDFLDVRDVARAYRLAVERGSPGDVYNVASGKSRRIGELLDLLIQQSSVDVEVRQDPARLRPVDVVRIVGDASKLRAATGWTPTIELESTLTELVDDWRHRLRSFASSEV
jgi:GDP-4-dehydro-6-deoxy-D-mannose reductase